MEIAVWIFGTLAVISLFLSHQMRGRGGILAFKLSADVFWGVHYFCLGAFAGMIPNAVGILRETVFINRHRSRVLASRLWPALFVLINATLGALKFSALYDLLPLCASAAVTVSLWIENPRLTKYISLPVSSAFLLYDLFVHSYLGVFNEALAILSILIFFAKERRKAMSEAVFHNDFETEKPLLINRGAPIECAVRRLSFSSDPEVLKKGESFAEEILGSKVADFEKEGDRMVHVSTFLVKNGMIYMTYYANTKEPSEDPKNQTARFAYAPLEAPECITVLDLQTTGDTVGGREIVMVYDTILMEKDEDTLYVMWTASTEDNYYRFYCPFSISRKALGKIGVNRFRVGEVVNDLSQSGIKSALAANGLPVKNMFADIGLMQKQSYRTENGIRYCYSGLYSGDFTCLVKSADLITWEYVSQPDFLNDSVFENATYVLGDTVYQFIRQQPGNPCGFLTAYDLVSGKWAPPVEIEDCQSRADFIFYRGGLYLFHAPHDREHIGIVRVDTEDLSRSEILLDANMKGSCFYPFVQYFGGGELAMSYTVDRKHIRLARFTLHSYL